MQLVRKVTQIQQINARPKYSQHSCPDLDRNCMFCTQCTATVRPSPELLILGRTSGRMDDLYQGGENDFSEIK